MKTVIEVDAHSRGITRLCHFTQARNLAHIATNPDGLKSTKALRADQAACFTATDTKRIDGYTDYICCSVEYPNAWYLSKAAEQEALFKDWVIVLHRRRRSPSRLLGRPRLKTESLPERSLGLRR
jgi:hypothetical protein